MRIGELRCKEIINVCTGERLGFMCDAEIDMKDGRLINLIVPGKCRFFGLFGRGEDYIVPIDCILRIGEDLILIDTKTDFRQSRRK